MSKSIISSSAISNVSTAISSITTKSEIPQKISIRDKDWIFHTLWSSCNSKGSSRCQVNIPLTILFRKGEPTKVLSTDNNGNICRVNLDDHIEVRDIDEHGFRGELLKKFRALRKLLINFNQNNKYNISEYDEEEALLCTATYADNTTEDLNLRTLDTLMRNESWRTQLVYIQGYIPISKSKKGLYNKEKAEEEKKSKDKAKSLPLPKDQIKVNNIILDIKKFAEKSYITKNEALVSRYGDSMSVISEEKDDNSIVTFNDINDNNITAPSTARTAITAITSKSQPTQYSGVSTDQKGLDIIDVEGVFNFDNTGKCYFMNCTYVAAMVKKNKDQIDDFIENERKSRVLTAAYSVTKDFLELLKHGQKRRLSIKESFSHFDVKQNKVIDATDLANGLGQIGIGVTKPVASAVVQLIGGIGAKYLSEDDFERFLQVNPDTLEESIGHILETDNIKNITNEMDIYGGFGISVKPKSKSSIRTYNTDETTVNLPANMEKVIPVSLKPSQRFDTEEDDENMKGNDKNEKGTTMSKRALKGLRKSQTQDNVKPIRSKKKDNKHYSLSADDYQHSLDNNKNLNLVTIYKELDGRMRRHPDELLHVDESVVMSYRLIQCLKPSSNSVNSSVINTALNSARTNEGVPEEKGSNENDESSKVFSNEDITINSGTISNIDDEDKRGFTLVVVPDLFMTLESLKKNLEEILQSYPFSRLVFVGLPGSPNTMWRQGWTLNSDFNARCIARLLQHLEKEKRLGSPDDPMFLMGIGSGLVSLARFISLYLPELPWLRRRIKSLVIVNGMLKHSKGYKQILRDLRSSMINASAFEFQELISSLHFSDDFLKKNGTTKVLNRFWSTRTDLRSDDVTEENTGSGYVGVLEQLRGILTTTDDYDGAEILLTKIPIIVVQSTDDIFVNPRHATMFQEDSLPPERRLVQDISDSLKKSAVHVCWLKAGHEVLEERNAFVLGLISNLAKLCSLKPVKAEISNNFEYSDKMVKDLMGLVLKRKEDIDNEIIDAEEAVRKEIEDKAAEKQRRKEEREAKRLAKLKEKAEAEQAHQLKKEKEALEKKLKEAKNAAALAEAEAELMKVKEQQRAMDEAKNAMAEERRLRKENAERLAAQERLRQEEERISERNECKEMGIEDNYSKQVENAIKAYEEALKTDKRLRLKEEKRKKQERERIQKELEAENERAKQARIHGRKLKIEGFKEIIKETETTLLQDIDEYAEDSPKVMELITSGYRQLPIVWGNYDRLVDGILRQQQLDQKLEKCKFLREAAQNDYKRLGRTVELVTASPSLVGASTPEGAQKDINQLNHLLEGKKDLYQELDLFCIRRAAQLQELQKQVKVLEDKFIVEENKMLGILQDCLDYENLLSNKLNDLKVTRERNIADKGKVMFQIQGMLRKKDIIEKEMKRIQNHKEKYIDSELDGSTKRFETDTLREYLAKCIHQEECSIKQAEKKVSKYDFDIGYSLYHISSVQSYYERLVFSIKYLRARNKIISKVPATEFARIFASRLEGAWKKHERDQIEKATKFKMMTEVGTSNPIERVRYKAHDLRSDDEKRFVGIDLILHPEMYVSLKLAEIEELRFDKKYHWELKKSDFLRIKSLPPFPNLALPFLNTSEEVEAHRIFNWYLNRRNDKFFENRDYHSEEVKEDFTHHHHHHHHEQQVQSLDIAEAAQQLLDEIEQDIMVKECMRNKIRWHCFGEQITTEEMEFLHMDQALCQYIYGSEKVETDYHEERKHCWHCPFSAKELLQLNEVDAQTYFETTKKKQEQEWGWASIKLNDCKHAKKLLDKYFTHDDETILGYARISAMDSIAKHILENLAEESARLIAHRKSAIGRKSVEMVQAKSNVERIWGSYEEVHPAALGMTSQSKYFTKAGYQPSREHPAAYAVHPVKDEDDDSVSSFGSDSELPTGMALRDIGLKTLLSLPGDSVDNHGNEHHVGQDVAEAITNIRQSFMTAAKDRDATGSSDEYVIVRNPHELAKQDPKELEVKAALIIRDDPYVLFEAQDLNLMGRASRLHKFQIPDREDVKILDITVSIVFQGEFTEKGYTMGRLAASLFRLNSNIHDKFANRVPEPVGWSPYGMQQPNLPDSLGRLVILHRPKVRPLRPGWYQVVLGAASNTKYSIRITGKCGQTALPVIDDLIQKVKEAQSYLPNILKDLEVTRETVHLTEMKKSIAEKLLDEATREHERSQKQLRQLTRAIKMDDQQMTLMEAERKQLEEDLDHTENEFDWWSTCLSSRTRELEDITNGLAKLNDLLHTKEKEKLVIKEKLEKDRHDLPACIAVLRGYKEACHVAHSLNTIVAVTNSGIAALAAETVTDAPIEVTPANELRKRLKIEGYSSLLLQEKQWFLLDQALNPYIYEWLKEKEEKEKESRLAMGFSEDQAVVYEAEVEAFRMTKAEILRIKAQPYHLLNRKEMIVRKLLTRYHDDPELLRKSQAAKTSNFDHHLAERVRIKNPRFFTDEEKEWSTIDRILHNDIWNFYSQHDDNAIFNDKNALAAKTLGSGDPKAKVQSTKAILEKANKKDHVEPEVDQAKLDNMKKLQKILGMSDTGGDSGYADINELSQSVRKRAKARAEMQKQWKCPFDKDKIFSIWKTPRHKLKDKNEIKVHSLLSKYNGLYSIYMQQKRESDAKKVKIHFSLIKQESHERDDMDQYLRDIVSEIDRVKRCSASHTATSVFHGTEQMYPTKQLYEKLELELSTQLENQIKERERSARYAIEDINSDDAYLSTDDDDTDDDEEGGGKSFAEKLQIKMRKKKAQGLMKAKESTPKKDNKKKHKKAELKGKSGASLAEAILANQLGLGGCLACRTSPCQWETSVDEEILSKRIHEVEKEVERVRADKDSAVFESEITLSAQLGGNSKFTRAELLDDLEGELGALRQNLNLDRVDKELHDAYASKAEFIEVSALHGYKMLLWTNNARVALQARQNRLIAMTVAREVCDEILEWMLEGWMFGERESQFNIIGYVPSVKKNGRVKGGQDQIKTVGAVALRMKARAQAKKDGVILDEARRGLMINKSIHIDISAQDSLQKEKVELDGKRVDNLLNETETTMKFGMFMLTLMYFRAMALVQREKKSWSGEGDDIGMKSKGKKMTDERMRMVDEEQKIVARKKRLDGVMERCKRGIQKRLDREAMLRKEIILKRVMEKKKVTARVEAVCTIQRVYRGGIDRRNAKRWALKRAELEAMHQLLSKTSIVLQRVWRGFLARRYLVVRRMEMAQFIAFIRVQEAEKDEEEYWKTHPWSRFKKDFKEWKEKTFVNASNREAFGKSRLTKEEEEALELMHYDENAENDDESESSDDDDDNEGGIVKHSEDDSENEIHINDESRNLMENISQITEPTMKK